MTAEPHPHFPHVFAPLQLRHRTLRARINFGAHTANMSVDGLAGDRHLGYYLERARGGAGMIVVEPVPVHRTAVLTRGNFRVDDDSLIPGFQAITDACHGAADVVMIQQLYHVGQHGDGENSFAPNWSPSGLPSYHDADGSHAMTEPEIDEIIAGFVSCALRAQRCGFDGVEIFAAYHALVDQFWTPWSNRRHDRWGGSFENRMRFSTAILADIRDACGDEFIVGLAVNIDPESPASLSVDEMQAIVAWHDERRLMDYVTCGTGSYFDFYKLMPTSLYPAKLGAPFAAALKSVVRHALVQCESHVRTPANAEEVIAAGQADMVSIVRGQIADPWLVTKARDGRPEEVRGCISCNQMCWGRRSRDYFISCVVNPSAGREFEWGGDTFTRTSASRRVLVVGGGPAGLEVARVSAERGHQVILVEASAQLGGQFRLAGLQPSRQQISELIDWYRRELERLDVDVRLDARLDGGGVASFHAEEVIIATGATPARRGFQRAAATVDMLPGAERAHVAAIHDVLDGSRTPLGRVLLVDDLGDWQGIGTAMFLQERGCSVTVATTAPTVAGGLFHSAADVPARRRFVSAGGILAPFRLIKAWHGDGVTWRDTLTDVCTDEPFDWLIIAETPTPDTALTTELTLLGIDHHIIGDCVAARRASIAIHEGRALAMTI